MEASNLKPLTAPEEEQKAAGVRVHDVQEGSSKPLVLETSPTKRQAYSRLLDKPNSRLSKAAKSISAVKAGGKQSRVASQPLTPSPSKGIRSSSSAPRINFMSGAEVRPQTAPRQADTGKGNERVRAVIEALEVVRGRGTDQMVLDLGKQTIESGGDVHCFDQFSAALLRLELPIDAELKGKLAALSVSLADSKKQTASLKDQMEACVSSLSPHFFQTISVRPLPLPDSELVIHAFLMLLKLHDSAVEVADSFKVMHHRAWKSFQRQALHPGKLLSTVRTFPQAVKHGKVTSQALAAIETFLQGADTEKIAADEGAVTLVKYVQVAGEYARSCELERSKEASSLQFLRLKDASPRRKLLTSLLNRSVEEAREEDSHSFPEAVKVDRSFQEPGHREELEEAKVVEVPAVSIVPIQEGFEVQEEAKVWTGKLQEQAARPKDVKKSPIRPSQKPGSRPKSIDMTRKSPDIRGKQAAIQPKAEAKQTPKAAPRRRPVSKPEPEPQPVAETPEKLRLAMLLDIKMRVFLQDKVLTSKTIPEPVSEEALKALLEVFRKELESSRETINPEEISEYCSKQDQSGLSALLTSLRNRVDPALSPNTSLSSWTHREIQRQKDRMSQTLTRLQLRKSLS